MTTFATRRLTLFALVGAIVSLALAASPRSLTPTADAAGDGSGGRAVAHKAGGDVVTASGAPDATFHRVSKAQAIEPTLGIDKKGDVYYTASSGVTNVDVWKSTDAAKNWTLASPTFPGGVKSHPLTLDPYIYVDESTGRIFNIDLTVACSYLSFSDDGGESWITNPLACGRPVNDHQTLFSGPPAISPMSPAYSEVVYYCWNDFGAGSSCSKSLDGGVSWAPGTQAFQGYDTSGQGQLCGGFHGHGVVGEDGTVYLPKEYCGQPWLGISRDEGLTWERVQVASNTTEFLGSDTSIAVDAKGNLYYTYETAMQELYLVTSTDGGKTWSKPMMVGHPKVNEVTLPTIDAGKPGKIAIAYMGSENSPFQECEPDCQDADYKDAKWNGYITMSTDVLGKTSCSSAGTRTSVVGPCKRKANPTFFSGTVNDRKDPIYLGRCDFSNRCGPVLDFIDIEVSPDGTPYGAFVDACLAMCLQSGSIDGQDAVVGRMVGLRLR